MIAPALALFKHDRVSPAVEAAFGETLKVIAKREGHAPRQWVKPALQCRTPPRVMERRRKVAGLLAEGHTQAQIARMLGLSPSAISHDLAEIRKASA